MSVNSKMTALANEVRELSGSSAKMGIDDMTTNVSNANEEVDNQTDLIAQIKAVVDNLPEAGDSDNNPVYTVKNSLSGNVMFGGTIIASEESVQFPIVYNIKNTAMLQIAISSDIDTFNVLINNSSTTIKLMVSKVNLNNGEISLNGTGGYVWWVFQIASLLPGDTIEVVAT